MDFIELEKKLEDFVVNKMNKDAAHDLAHIKRVLVTAKKMATELKADLAVVIPACWLHDCVNVDKSTDQRSLGSKLSADAAIEFLAEINYDKKYYKAIYNAIHAHSFSANIKTKTLEAEIVQDADRIDALGAIGIARCLMYSASKGRQLYVIEDPFAKNRDLDDNSAAIDHFYTKLESIHKTMKTDLGKKIAKKRWKYMEGFINQLNGEIK